MTSSAKIGLVEEQSVASLISYCHTTQLSI